MNSKATVFINPTTSVSGRMWVDVHGYADICPIISPTKRTEPRRINTTGEERRPSRRLLTSRLGLRKQQQIECDDVRDHQQGHVDDRDRVRGAQLPRQRRKASVGGVVIVEDEVDHSNEIEGNDEKPEEWTHPYREKR